MLQFSRRYYIHKYLLRKHPIWYNSFMSQVSYRKYRPQKYAEVINQDAVKTILQNAVKTGHASHAYLFTGPRGVGKTTIARILAKALNCLNCVEGEPCAVCENCVLIQEGRFLDLIEIDAASYTGVDNIRDIIDHVKFAPSRGKYKVFIIDEVHMLSKAAFNALLKTLEEPPAHAVFILATTEIQKVPATIISRSQRFDFKRVSEKDIMELLNSVKKDFKAQIAPEALSLIARAAEGSFRDALSILDQILSFSGEQIAISQVEEILGITRVETTAEFLDLLAAGNQVAAVKFIKDLSNEGKDPILFVKNLLEYLRLALFVKIGAAGSADLGLTHESLGRLAGQSQKLSNERLLDIIKKFLEAYREAKNSPVQELPILSAIMALGGTEKLSAEEKILKAPQGTSAEKPPILAIADLHLGAVVEKWADVLSKVKEYNHSLLSSLRLGRLVGMDGQHLILAFPYNFHKEIVEARKNKIIVEQVLEDVLGQIVRVKVVLEKELPKAGGAEETENDLLGEALKVLGDSK